MNATRIPVAGTSGAYTHRSLTPLNADRMSSPYSDAASHHSNYSHDDRDEEDEDEDENGEDCSPHAAGNDHGCSRDNTRYRQQMHKPWLESDEERLLSYRIRWVWIGIKSYLTS